MNFGQSVEINKSLDLVWKEFDHLENMYRWQPNLKSVEHISGNAGEAGFKAKVTYDTGNRTEIFELTVVSKTIQQDLIITLSSPKVFVLITDRFEIFEGTQTKWTRQVEVKLSGFLSSFRKHTDYKSFFLNQMTNFKQLLEEEQTHISF